MANITVNQHPLVSLHQPDYTTQVKNQPENTANLEKVKEIRNTSVLFS